MAMTNMLESKIEQSIDDGFVDGSEINEIADLTKDKQTEAIFINECKDKFKDNAELKDQLSQYINILEGVDNGVALGGAGVTESRLEKACIDSNYKGVTIVDGVDISTTVRAFQLYANIFIDMPSNNTSKLDYGTHHINMDGVLGGQTLVARREYKKQQREGPAQKTTKDLLKPTPPKTIQNSTTKIGRIG